MREEVVTSFGEQATVCRTAKGNILCPVCGHEYSDSAKIVAVNFLGGLESCPSCFVQMGYDDFDEMPPVATNPIGERWERLRRKWLDKLGWPEWAVRQAKDGLGVDVRR